MKIACIVLNVIFALGFIPSLFLLLPTVMMFDAPGSRDSPYTWLTALSLLSIPFVIIVAQIVSWIFFARGNMQIAFGASLSPLVPVFFAFVGFLLITVLQGGSFTAN